MTDSISPAQARRIALAAQGFADRRPVGVPSRRHLRRVVDRTGVIQMDSVNVLQRAHYLPLFSRLGSYPTDLLDHAAYRRPRELFEYWGHAASLLPVTLQPLLRWRMARARDEAWGGMRRIATERPDFVRWVLDEVAAKGPVTAAEVEEDARRPKTDWGWNWSEAKHALEYLFWCGDVSAATRDNTFTRTYDLTERVLPRAVLDTPTPTVPDAHRELVRISAAALGVAAETELRDYFRLPVAGARQAIAELVEEGALRPVTVPGWKPRAYLHADAKLPRRVHAAALVSPFDPLVWERDRTERLFNFRYRIEIYVPAHLRVHGYYVLPFLLGDQLVARVDLKADRRAGVLRVPGAWLEPGQPVADVAPALADALGDLAAWLGLGSIAPPESGDLASALGVALRHSGGTV
ncbi:winged helix-turn-helix domain-containing protein [Luedemannella flava]|uniref:Winged helix-turn-helix domain-containing protein n=1 Tax=Luedemannella flava TaxID=349316 RepID=A0ABP4YXE8_9ACTN